MQVKNSVSIRWKLAFAALALLAIATPGCSCSSDDESDGASGGAGAGGGGAGGGDAGGSGGTGATGASGGTGGTGATGGSAGAAGISGMAGTDASVDASSDATTDDGAPLTLVHELIGIRNATDFVEVNPANATMTTIGTLTDPHVVALAFDGTTGTLYGLSDDLAGSNQIVRIDACTGAIIGSVPVTLEGGTVYFNEGFAIDGAGNGLLASSIDGSLPGDSISETLLGLDLVTGVVTSSVVHDVPPNDDLDGLLFAAGTLYGYNVEGLGTDNTTLVSLNPTSGQATELGSVSAPSQYFGLAYDAVTTTFYAIDGKPQHELVTLDVSTNVETSVGAAAGLTAIAFVDVSCADGG
jgi:hypothetical protein